MLVVVLRHDRARIELDDAQREPLAVRGPRGDAVPDPLEWELGEVVEAGHGCHYRLRLTAAVTTQAGVGGAARLGPRSDRGCEHRETRRGKRHARHATIFATSRGP